MQASLRTKTLLWESIAELERLAAEGACTLLEKVDVDAMIALVARFARACAACERALPSCSAVARLRAQLDTFAALVPAVGALRAPALRPRHWQRIAVTQPVERVLYAA